LRSLRESEGDAIMSALTGTPRPATAPKSRVGVDAVHTRVAPVVRSCLVMRSVAGWVFPRAIPAE
jgi:hypothetical protein